MKKLVYTAFVAFWSIVITLVVLNVLLPRERRPATAEPRWTLQEVASHATPEDCWMAIDGGVYELSEYLPRHPTDLDVIAQWCGREASEAMHTMGGRGRDHSDFTWRRLERYRIGALRER